MDTARTIGSRKTPGRKAFLFWFIPLCGICLAGIVFLANVALEGQAAQDRSKAASIAEASDVLARYIASVASANPADRMDDEAVNRFPIRRLVDLPKPPVRIGDRSVLFFEGLSHGMCKGLAGRTIGNVESVSLNGGPFSDHYDGSLCRSSGTRSRGGTNWIAVIRKTAPTP